MPRARAMSNGTPDNDAMDVNEERDKLLEEKEKITSINGNVCVVYYFRQQERLNLDNNASVPSIFY